MPDMYIMCMRVRTLTNDVHINYKQKEALNSAVRGFSFCMYSTNGVLLYVVGFPLM